MTKEINFGYATGINVDKLKAVLPEELITSNEEEFSVLAKLMLNVDTLHELNSLTTYAVNNVLSDAPSAPAYFKNLVNFIQANIFCARLASSSTRFLAMNSLDDSQSESPQELYVSSDVALHLISLSAGVVVSQTSLEQCGAIAKAMGTLINLVKHLGVPAECPTKH